jgi:hypothetical protein
MQVKLKKAKETGHNLENKKREKDIGFPPVAGETTRDELYGSQTLLQV